MVHKSATVSCKGLATLCPLEQALGKGRSCISNKIFHSWSLSLLLQETQYNCM